MEIENIGGLPAHPLLVHLPVVLIPLAAIGAVLIAVRPSWRDRYGWWVVGMSFVGFIGTVLAAGSGETLEEQVDETSALEAHAQAGETARTLAFVFFAITLLVMAVSWYLRRRAVQPGATPLSESTRTLVAVASGALLVIGALAASASIYSAGHKGATVTWGDLDKEGNDTGGTGTPEDHDDDDGD